MNPTQLHRKPLHPRNTSQNLGNQVINILENLGIVKNIAMNIKNTMKFLGRILKGRMNMSRISLKFLGEWQNSLRLLGKSKRGKPRGKEKRRRFSLLKSLLQEAKG